ncbi:MAG: Hint domain-containing protein [Phycisphaerales bacterium]
MVARAGAHAASLDTCDIPEAVPLAEQLETTDGRWVPARDLAEGDAVRTMSPQGVAGTATVTMVRGRHAVVPVYNLTVEGTSRYLVGECGVVVHNKGEGAGPAPRMPGQFDSASYPKPPAWNRDWDWAPGSGDKPVGWRWWDPDGGEWRWHSPDKHHATPHWDYNPWETWNSPWQNIYPPNCASTGG